MSQRTLKPKKLTAEGFAPHGDVIAADPARARAINYGATTRFHDLAGIDVGDGRAIVSIFRSTPPAYPFTLTVMEKHPLASQAFMPLSGRPYLVVVAPVGKFNPNAIEAFAAEPSQGVNYRRGVWHHYNLALGAVSDFLVVDREGPAGEKEGENLEEISLASFDPILLVP